MQKTKTTIPKIIHYCWFGGKEKPELAKKCIASWKKFCPDYEIVEWNESNFDINMNDFTSHTYKIGKLGFVPDYARLWIIHKYGGVYLDTDVELIKNLDPLLENQAFFGYEDEKHINLGQGFGAVKGNPVLQKMMEDYIPPTFQPKKDKDYLLPSPQKNSASIRNLLNSHTNKKQIFKCSNATFYPQDFFCPINYDTKKIYVTDNTYSIHWFMGSWQSKYEKITRPIKKKIKKIIGEDRYNATKRRLGL